MLISESAWFLYPTRPSVGENMVGDETDDRLWKYSLSLNDAFWSQPFTFLLNWRCPAYLSCGVGIRIENAKGKETWLANRKKGATFADYKNSLINDSIPFLCLLPSFNHFLPFVLLMSDDDVLPLLPILQSEPIRAASQCRNFFKYGPVTTEKRKKKTWQSI